MEKGGQAVVANLKQFKISLDIATSPGDKTAPAQLRLPFCFTATVCRQPSSTYESEAVLNPAPHWRELGIHDAHFNDLSTL